MENFEEKWLTCEMKGTAQQTVKWKYTEDALIAVGESNSNNTAQFTKEDEMGYKYFKSFSVMENEVSKGEMAVTIKYHPIFKEMQMTFALTSLEPTKTETQTFTADGSCSEAD